jgi:hypothetical protein
MEFRNLRDGAGDGTHREKATTVQLQGHGTVLPARRLRRFEQSTEETIRGEGGPKATQQIGTHERILRLPEDALQP